MAYKSVKWFKQEAQVWRRDDRRQTDRPRYREMCRSRRNRLCGKSDSAL